MYIFGQSLHADISTPPLVETSSKDSCKSLPLKEMDTTVIRLTNKILLKLAHFLFIGRMFPLLIFNRVCAQ